MATEHNAIEDGYKAYYNGINMQDNPYQSEDSLEYYSWVVGYQNAKTQAFVNWIDSSDTRNTSIELMIEIWKVSNDDINKAEKMWRDGPSLLETFIVRGNLLHDGINPETLHWGDKGDTWQYCNAVMPT